MTARLEERFHTAELWDRMDREPSPVDLKHEALHGAAGLVTREIYVALGLAHHGGVGSTDNSSSRRFRQRPVASTYLRLLSADITSRVLG
jgi:hypothetical protein